MERYEFTICGPESVDLSAVLRSYPEMQQVGYEGDRVNAVAVERFFARTMSDLQATIVMERHDETTIEGAILSGGGGSGLLRLSLGSESAMADTLIGDIQTYCEDNGLEFRLEDSD